MPNILICNQTNLKNELTRIYCQGKANHRLTYSLYNFKLAVMSKHIFLDALSKLAHKPNPTEHNMHVTKRNLLAAFLRFWPQLMVQDHMLLDHMLQAAIYFSVVNICIGAS